MCRFLTLSKAKIMVLALLLGYMFILSPPQVAAQGISVDPLSWDFGDVLLGSSPTKTFRISSTEILPLTVSDISFTAYSSPAFSFEQFLLDGTIPITGVPPSYTLWSSTWSPDTPPHLLDVTVRFSPDSLGLHTASIHIWSDAAPPDGTLFLPLSGTCVPTPSAVILGSIGITFSGWFLRRRRML
jgi:hypothetical protein